MLIRLGFISLFLVFKYDFDIILNNHAFKSFVQPLETDAGWDKDSKTIALFGTEKQKDDWKAENEKLEEFLHKGISNREFYKSFALAEHVEVKKATMSDGILQIILEKNIPDSEKPKKIKISG